MKDEDFIERKEKVLLAALGMLLFFVFIKKKAWNEFYDRNINHLNEK